MNRFILTFLFCLVTILSNAQTYSWVYFHADSTESIDNKALMLKALDIEIIGTSKWLYAACVVGCPNNAKMLSSVEKVVPLGKYKVTNHQVEQIQEDFKYGKSDWQLEMIGLNEYHKKGYTGKNVTIGLFDGGFYRVDSLPAFDTLRKRNQILAEWDFFYNDTNVYVQDGHGMYVLSIAGGYWPDSIMGAAPDANFLLARTEITNREIHLEEYAWIKALEWADSIGVDIIHSSLGYSTFDSLEGDYIYADMDGRTTVITQATDMAFSKGIFVTNSAGNEGANPWHYITAPCDGRYVLCVGAVDSNQVHADFSSYGPTADGRIKPDVVAMGKGVTYLTKEGEIKTGSGTSFSGPIIAGMVACLKQAWPNVANEHLLNAIIKSCDKFNNPDTAYGFGLPNVQRADSLLARFVSMQSLNAQNLKVYPNPGTGIINLQSDVQILSVTIHDMQGRLVIKELIHEIYPIISVDMGSFLDGFYLLTITMEGGNSVQKRYIKSQY